MHKLAFPAALAALAIWLVGGYWWLSQSQCLDSTASNNHGKLQASSLYLQIKDDTFQADSAAAILFPVNKSTPVLEPSAINALQQTAQHLLKNPHKSLRINGVFNNTERSNLGLARALSVHDLLVNFGADAQYISVNAELNNNAPVVNDKVYEALRFEFLEKALEEKPVGNFQPLNVYFNPNQTSIRNLPTLDSYFENIKQYLKQNKNTSLTITGHADSYEGKTKCKKLSQKRANAMRQFLLNQGFASRQIQVKYASAESPLAKVGNIKNRRIEIRVIVP